MNSFDILKISGAILTTLGGGAAIVFLCSSWLGKVWANRLMEREKAEHNRELEALRNQLTQDTESYKLKLKKSEFIFEREFQAASEFVGLLRNLHPRFRHPDMDWSEACDEIASRFAEIESLLDEFLSHHGAVLGQEVRKLIGECSGIAATNKFGVTRDEVSYEANKAADELFEKMEKAEKLLLDQVHAQAST